MCSHQLNIKFVILLFFSSVPGAIATDAPVTLLKSAENKWKQI